MMEKATIIEMGDSQAVCLPRGVHFDGTEVFVGEVDGLVVLVPVGAPWSTLNRSLELFSDDFMASREQPESAERANPGFDD